MEDTAKEGVLDGKGTLDMEWELDRVKAEVQGEEEVAAIILPNVVHNVEFTFINIYNNYYQCITFKITNIVIMC